MKKFFATSFPSLELAEQGQRIIEAYADQDRLKLLSSVIIAKDESGGISRHNGKTPGAIGAVMSALVGGVVGLVGGPPLAFLGTVAGGISGGWFDLLRVEDRDAFMNRVAQELDKTRIALLGEAVDPGEDIRKSIEDELAQIGGVALN
jgi:uncharacterized membrane protein